MVLIVCYGCLGDLLSLVHLVGDIDGFTGLRTDYLNLSKRKFLSKMGISKLGQTLILGLLTMFEGISLGSLSSFFVPVDWP